MGKIDLTKTEATVEQVSEDTAEARKLAAANVRPEVGVPATYKPVLGDYIPSMADMRLPRVNIVFGVGDLKDDFPVGALVYNHAITIYEQKLGNKPETPPAEVVILGWLPIRYAERVPGGARGMLVSTEQEVADSGGTLDWNEWNLKKEDGMRYFQTLAEAVLMIKAPKAVENDTANFPFLIDGSRYSLGIMGMKGTAYTNGAKHLFTARRMGVLREGGYPSFSWFVRTVNKTYGPNSIPLPEFRPAKPTSESFQRFAVNLVNGTDEAGPTGE